MSTQHKPTQPRFVMKFTNGLHVIFDRIKFEVAETFRTRKEMEAKFNAPPKVAQQRS